MSQFQFKWRPRHTAWLVFILAFLVQFAVLLSISSTNYFLPDSDDMKFYNDWARRIAAGQWSDRKSVV